MTADEERAAAVANRKYLTEPRPFPVMMDYNGLVQALREEWNDLDPVDESRPLIWDAVRAIVTLCAEVEEREEYVRRMYASINELVAGLECHGATKWMPHRVERAVQILNELRPHDGN